MSLLTAEKPKNWIVYWNQDNFWTHSRLWRINAELFFRRAAPIVHFKKTDSVLNVGCGPSRGLERSILGFTSSCGSFSRSIFF